MKIKFFGTAAGVPTSTRECSAAMITVGESKYFIDLGAPVFTRLVREGISTDGIRAVFFTHIHSDHALYTPDFIKGINEREEYTFRSVRYYVPEDHFIRLVTNYYNALIGDISAERNLFFRYGEGVVYSDENITVRAMPTGHMAGVSRPAYSFLVEGDGVSVLFSGDLSSSLSENDFPRAALDGRVDLLILEYAHFDVEDMIPYLTECKIGRLIFNHISRFEEKKPLIDALSSSGRFSFPISAAYDGEEIII